MYILVSKALDNTKVIYCHVLNLYQIIINNHWDVKTDTMHALKLGSLRIYQILWKLVVCHA